MHIQLLQDLAVVLMVAAVVAVLFHRLKQPVVLGYILAGFIIGPHTPPFPLVENEETIRTLAELGVVMLMFALGLEFNLRKLKKVGTSAFIAAFAEIVLMVWIGYQIGRAFGWGRMDSIFLGAILSISSTTIIIKALKELGKSREPFAQLMFGILIIEDVLGIAMIALLSGIAMTGELRLGDIGVTLGKLSIFLAVVLVAGLIVAPRLLGYVAKFRSNEMLLITVLGLCFGVSLLAAQLGYSVALGAFVIGAVISEAREIRKIEALTEPVRDMFSAIFFVAIGLLIDPVVLMMHWRAVVVVTLAVVLGKIVTCALGTFAGGSNWKTSVRVGTGLAQIGEFSFIIAALGLTLGVTSGFLYPIAVAVSAITTLLTPYLIRGADGLTRGMERVVPERFLHAVEAYTHWVGEWRASKPPGLAKRLIRRWIWQMALNLVLVTGIFASASFVAQKRFPWLERLPGGLEGIETALWFGALVLSLPLLIAVYRKLQALGMLLGEVAGKRAKEKGGTARKVFLATAVPMLGVVGIGVLVLILSSALLPSRNVLIVLLGVTAVLTIVLWRSWIRIYAKGQIALGETLAEKEPPVEKEPVGFPELLRSASLETVRLRTESPAVGKLIRELGLREATGATILAIQRDGRRIVNPEPDEELFASDAVLLLGNDDQVREAREFLAPANGSGGSG